MVVDEFYVVEGLVLFLIFYFLYVLFELVMVIYVLDVDVMLVVFVGFYKELNGG